VALAAPLLTVAERSRSRLWAVPVYWHLLSLDAPTVAVLWASSFAHAARIDPSANALAVLGIGTWLIYVADRLLDARAACSRLRHNLRERHFFHARHRRAFLVAAAAALLVLLRLVRTMPAAARRGDALLFAISILYFAAVHLPFTRTKRAFPRELAVGILFACATAVPAWSGPNAPHAALRFPVALFAGLCCLNCLAIEIWEQPVRPGSRISVPAIAACIAAASTALILVVRNSANVRLAASVFASAILLLALDRLHRRFTQRAPGPDASASFHLALRVAADAALLTPLLFVLPWRG
jgi:hypothetical protein